MRIWPLLFLLLLLAAGGAAVWYMRSGHAPQARQDNAGESPEVAYAYEAHDVVLRQMGPDGRQAYQVEARSITQRPDNGRISAQTLTLYHDPPGTEIGGPNRWTLTADSGDLPAEGGVITLAGHVRAHGLLVGSSAEMTLATDHLRYDPSTQELSSDDEVRLTWGDNVETGRGLRANIRTSEVQIESDVHATLVPR